MLISVKEFVFKNPPPAQTKLPTPSFPCNSGCRRDQPSSEGFSGPCPWGNSSCSPSRDKMCGKLYCSGGTEMPREGSLLAFRSCKGSFPRSGEEDPGMILDGTKCGNGMVSAEWLFLLSFPLFQSCLYKFLLFSVFFI